MKLHSIISFFRLSPPKYFLGVIFCCLLILQNSFAEVFPVKTYTTADGLLRDEATKIKQDSRGFIWFLMPGGISRFDGYAFTNYTTDDGLPSRVEDIIETTDGTIYISTFSGLARFNPSGIRQKFDGKNPNNPDSMFQVLAVSSSDRENRFGKLIEAEKNILYATNQNGLFRIQLTNDLPIVAGTGITAETISLAKDSKGNVWVGTWGKGLFIVRPDGKVENYTFEQGLPKIDLKNTMAISSIFEDNSGRIWVGGRNQGGLCRLVENPQLNQTIVENCFTKKDGLSNDWIKSLYQSKDKTIWIPTAEKLTQLSGFNEQGKPNFRILDEKNDLTDKEVNDFIEDRDGNFWIATNRGVKKVSKQGFTKFDENDGLPVNATFSLLFETNEGEIVGVDHPNERNISVFRNGKFEYIKPNYPKEIKYWGLGANSVLQTDDGEWWVTVGSSREQQKKYGLDWVNAPVLVRFPKVENLADLAKIKPKKIYYASNLPNISQAMQIYEDKRGDIWIIGLGKQISLYRWEKKTEKFIDYTKELDLGGGWFNSFAEDNDGNLWIGGSVSRKSDPQKRLLLLRYNQEKFTNITLNNIFIGMLNYLFLDSNNKLWAATSRKGVIRFDDLDPENPKFTVFNTEKGLSDNLTSTITEDRFGRIYVGSGRGIDQINVETNEVRHFNKNDGLPAGDINVSKTDKTGAIWFGSPTGIARFVPEVDKLRQTPNIFISGLRVAGESQKISELGETVLQDAEFTSDKNNLAIYYLGLGASLGEDLKYQYQLGDENSEWITTKERTLNFANLSAGDYKFAVRAVTSDGLISPNPATFSFKILRPIYLRWWFLTLAALVIGFVIWQLYRFRVRRLIEIERTRTRIATDLHDDIGSDLSKISLLSEVVKMQMINGNEDSNRLLTTIAETSRKSVDSMRDIVWAINPTRDSLNDLVSKMRSFAEERLIEKNIKLIFNAPNDHQNLKLSMDTRREIWLIFKESLTNSAKHANCSQIAIDFEITGKEIRLNIKDNGKGFDTSQEFEGNGLSNMKRRCENLKGKFELTSSQENGTNISAKFPQI